MGEPCKAVMFHGLGQGGRGDVVACGGGGGGDDRVSDSESATGLSSGVVSSGSLFSSRSSLTDDDATSPPEGGRKSSSSLSSSDSMQLDGGGADGGPLYELAPLLAHLPVRTGLSKYYQGMSRSFTSLSEAKCVEDLAKKTTPYTSRMRAYRGYAAAGLRANRNSRYVPGPCSKTITKKTPRGSSDRLLSIARSTSLLHSSGKPPEMSTKALELEYLPCLP